MIYYNFVDACVDATQTLPYEDTMLPYDDTVLPAYDDTEDIPYEGTSLPCKDTCEDTSANTLLPHTYDALLNTSEDDTVCSTSIMCMV